MLGFLLVQGTLSTIFLRLVADFEKIFENYMASIILQNFYWTFLRSV